MSSDSRKDAAPSRGPVATPSTGPSAAAPLAPPPGVPRHLQSRKLIAELEALIIDKTSQASERRARRRALCGALRMPRGSLCAPRSGAAAARAPRGERRPRKEAAAAPLAPRPSPRSASTPFKTAACAHEAALRRHVKEESSAAACELGALGAELALPKLELPWSPRAAAARAHTFVISDTAVPEQLQHFAREGIPLLRCAVDRPRLGGAPGGHGGCQGHLQV